MLIKSGFTLFEILIVIGIISFILYISIGFFKLNNDTLIMQELEKLYSCMLYLQSKAQIEQKNQYLNLNLSDNSYTYNNYPNNIKILDPISFGFIENSKGPPSNPKVNINRAITFKDNKITFYKDKTISSGIIYMIDKNKNFMYALSTGIANITYIRKYKYIKDSPKSWNLIN